MIVKLMGSILKEFEDEAKRLLHSMDLDVLTNQDYSYFRYLMVLQSHPNINQNDLARYVNVNKGSASKAVKFLLNHELVLRIQDEKDSRVKKLCLTDLGAKLCEDFRGVVSEVENRLMQGFTKQDVLTLKKMLSKSYSNISNEDDKLLFSLLD